MGGINYVVASSGGGITADGRDLTGTAIEKDLLPAALLEALGPVNPVPIPSLAYITANGRDTTGQAIEKDMLPAALFDVAGVTTIPSTSGGGAPTGAAGGSLAGTYPNPTFSGRDASVDKINQDMLPAALWDTPNGVTIGGLGSPNGVVGGSLAGTLPNPTFAGRDSSVDAINKDMLPAWLIAPAAGVFYPNPPSGVVVIGDANYTMQATDRVIVLNTALTAQRTITTVTPNVMPAGTRVMIIDGGAGANTPCINPVGDLTLLFGGLSAFLTVNKGTVSPRISMPFGFLELESDGFVNWTIINASDDIQHFTGNGTWTKRPGYKTARVSCWGGGGSGGSGDSGATGAAGGGSGGGAGTFAENVFDITDLGATETVTVPAAAVGGTSSTTALGKNGNLGGTCTFGAKVTAAGGRAGIQGKTTTTGATAQTSGQPWTGLPGAAGNIAGAGVDADSTGAALQTGLLTFSPGGGGGGGAGVTGAGTAGGKGGIAYGQTAAAAGGTAGGAGAGGLGGLGNSPTQPSQLPGGGGGGGGGGGAATTGGAGNTGGTPGGGGGGGGGTISPGASGAGGDGGKPLCIVVCTR